MVDGGRLVEFQAWCSCCVVSGGESCGGAEEIMAGGLMVLALRSFLLPFCKG